MYLFVVCSQYKHCYLLLSLKNTKISLFNLIYFLEKGRKGALIFRHNFETLNIFFFLHFEYFDNFIISCILGSKISIMQFVIEVLHTFNDFFFVLKFAPKCLSATQSLNFLSRKELCS